MNTSLNTGDAAGDIYTNVEGLVGSNFADTFYGSSADDSLNGWLGDDFLFGGDGADTILGEVGNDQLFGQFGDDYLDGGEGNDYLTGGADNDTLHGGNGDDDLHGDEGNNQLYGEAGNDVFSFFGESNDVIHDFVAGEDKINLHWFAITQNLTFAGMDTDGDGTLENGEGNSVIAVAVDAQHTTLSVVGGPDSSLVVMNQTGLHENDFIL